MKPSSLIKFAILNVAITSSFTLHANPVNTYVGIPKQDTQFAQFLEKNKNKKKKQKERERERGRERELKQQGQKTNNNNNKNNKKNENQ